MSIATAILDAAQDEARRHPGARVCRVGLRVGEWAGVDPEALHFCFDALAASGDGGAPELDIEFRPRQNRCPSCTAVFVIKEYRIECPDCGQAATDPVSGNELELAYVELEEP